MLSILIDFFSVFKNPFLLFSEIDECSKNNGGCDQRCINEPGTYSCKCEMGYKLEDDNHSCAGSILLVHIVYHHSRGCLSTLKTMH